jgi:hypothetical protein
MDPGVEPVWYPAAQTAPVLSRDQAFELLGEAESLLDRADRLAAMKACDAAAWAYRRSLALLARLLAEIGPETLAAGCGPGPDPGDGGRHLARRAGAIHNRALSGLLRVVGCREGSSRTAVIARLSELGVTLCTDDPELAAIPWNELWLCADYHTTLVKDPVEWPGLGVPLIVYHGKRDRPDYPEHAYPPRWKFAATAFARLSGPASEMGPLQIVLVDPRANTEVEIGKTIWPIAADLTTPVIHLLSHSGYRTNAFAGLFRPEQLTDEEGIALVHPYRSGRIPLVLIHGMGCSPRIMADIVNSIHADPRLRERYQVLIAYYTSGDTVLQDSTKLRRSFHALRDCYDPGHSDPAWDHSVVLGHSLGGPIARILTSFSDRQLEQTIFTVPFSSLRLSSATRDRVAEAIYFEPILEIRRVVYLCGTMHGSRLADGVEARFLGRLIPRRSALEEFHSELLAFNGPQVLNPSYRNRAPSSIDNQSPESPLLEAINRLRPNPGLTAHSIQADATPNLPQERSTDLLVPYSSSYIGDAVSRLVVPWTNHFCTHNRAVLDEVCRILHEHLDAEATITTASGTLQATAISQPKAP